MGKPTSFGIAIFILKAVEFVLENFRVSAIHSFALYCFYEISHTVNMTLSKYKLLQVCTLHEIKSDVIFTHFIFYSHRGYTKL